MRKGVEGMKRYVIIGNGVAAVGCIEGIRSLDRDTEIVVVSGEGRPTYCRPLISYYLENKTDLDKMLYRPAGFYEENGCRVLYGVRAEAIDSGKKTVSLSSGESVEYSALCVATGSVPFVPNFEGLETVKHISCFMTAEDALAIEGMLFPGARVLIMGAGFIGLKCAEGLRDKVGSVTVCDLAPHILSSILDDESAEMMEQGLEANGIRLILGDTASRFADGNAFLQSGEEVEFDILVLAVGVRPDTRLFAAAGGKVDRGIVTDEHMKTSLADVYAAGDCAESFDVSCGEQAVLANMPNAYLQGHTVGVNMAGGTKAFDKGIKMNSIGFFGQHVITAGSRGEDCQVFAEKGADFIKKLYVKNDRLVGYILLGNVDRAGIYTSLIREGTALSALNFDLLTRLPALAAFPAEHRKAVLGGVV